MLALKLYFAVTLLSGVCRLLSSENYIRQAWADKAASPEDWLTSHRINAGINLGMALWFFFSLTR
jgi:hypothetical protein